MNYVIIQNDQVPETVKAPFKIIQMFTDEGLLSLGTYIQSVIDDHSNDMTDEGRKAAGTLLELIGQWENETQ